MEPQSFHDRHTIGAIHMLFGNDESLIFFLFHHKESKLRLSVDELLGEARCLSHSDFLLIQTAIDLWCGEAKTPLCDLLAVLADDVFLRVLTTLAYKRELVEAWEALSCCE